MKTYLTEVLAVSKIDGRVASYAGPRIKANSHEDAEKYCEDNGLGYCKVLGLSIQDIDFMETTIINDTTGYYIYNDMFAEDNIIPVLKWIEETEEGVLCINSGGGLNWAGELILEALHKKPGIKLKALSVACSAAFNLFINCKNEKELSEGFIYGMTHLSTVDTDYRSSFIEKGEANIALKESFKLIHQKEIEFSKTFMTVKELKDFKKGRDVWFNSDRMKEIIDKTK